MKIAIIDGRKRIKIYVHKVSSFGKISGLMFKNSKTENLLFEFSKNVRLSIHSLFVFFPFVAVWLNDKNKVIEKRKVSPFILSVKPRKSFRKLVEIPFNSKNNAVLRKVGFSVGKEKI